MTELQLKYGCNPNQKPSRVYMEDGSALPITVLNGRPGYINLLDALNGYQLVKELKTAPLHGQAVDTRSLPASDATSLPSSATLGVGKHWGYSGDELRANRYRFKSQLCH